MAGQVQGRGQTSSHRHSHSHSQSSQASQLRKRPESKKSTQGSAAAQTQSKPEDPSSAPKPKLRTSCDGCQEAKLGCSQEKPTCRRCLRHGIPCIYSPFRRIGRPRKSTNPRSTNVAPSGKSRIKKESVDETIDVSNLEGLPELETDTHFGSMFFDPVPAPPSSPASPESNGGGAWYPWTADGNSLCNGFPMNLDHSNNLMETDPFSNTMEYIDLDSCLDNHHNMFMDCAMPRDGAFQMGQTMPTPPSSISAEMMTMDEAMPGNFDTHGMSSWQNDHAPLDQSSLHQTRPPSLTDGASGLKLKSTHEDFNSLKALRTSGLDISFHPQITKPSVSQAFGPSPELTPPPSAKPSSAQTPCGQRCSSALIKQLACLSQHLSDSMTSPLDTILQVEKDAHSLCKKIITCTPCITNKSSYLLFSMVLEQIIRLLETAIPQKAPASDACTLSIGTFEFDQDTKMGLLKQYLLSRLGAFADVLGRFGQVVRNADTPDSETAADEADGDYNSNVASDMLRDVGQRLDVLRKNIDTWV